MNDSNVTSGYYNITQNSESSLFYDTSYKIIAVTLFSILFIVGFCGNILVIYVVYRSPKMKTPTNFYLVSLAVADCLVLVGGTLPAIPEYFFYKEQWLYGSVMCSILVYLQYLGINVSALSITAFTIERYIGICHPMKAQVMCTTKRAKIIIAGLWLCSVLYNAYWLYLATTMANTLSNNVTIQSCTFRINREQYRYPFMVDLILFYILPLTITCILYILIAITLHKSTHDMKKPIRKQSHFKPTIQKLIADRSICNDFQQTMLGDASLVKRMETARSQVVRMLIVVTVLFAVLWLPYRAWVVYNSFATEENRFYNNWYFLFARGMVFLNNAMNPVLYSAMSKKFRTAFVLHTFMRRCIKTEKLPLTRLNTDTTLINKAQSTKRSVQVIEECGESSPRPTLV